MRIPINRFMVAAIVVVLCAAVVGIAWADPLGGLPAESQDFAQAESAVHTYPRVDAHGGSGTASWRVVRNTGNCCENYISATQDGTILDFGAGRLRLSKDRGASWQTIRPGLPALIGDGGEGAVVPAPNGDILAMNWDPWTGDRLETFKYEAASGKWFYSHGVLKVPFYDRPWLSVVPGPFTVGADTHPYLAILKAGWPSKDVWFYSYDGLNYFQPASKISEELTTVTRRPLSLRPDPALDWIQPLTTSGITPLPGGGALAADMDFLSVGDPHAAMLPPEIRWNSFRFPGVVPTGRLLADSKGWLHHISFSIPDQTRFEYRVSTDNGASWTSTSGVLPDGMRAEDWDFKAHGALGVTALAVHAHDASSNVDQDLLYEFRIESATPVIDNLFYLGQGDLAFDSSFGVDTTPRFDFASVAILPDGTLVTSFVDSEHRSPAVAVLMSRDGSAPHAQPTAMPTSSAAAPNPEPSASSANPSTSPEPVIHERALTLSLRKHLVAKGTLSLTSSEPRCTANVSIAIEHRRGTGWRAIRDVTTTSGGRFRARLPDRSGRYRAVASELELGDATCAATTSPVVRHAHRY